MKNLNKVSAKLGAVMAMVAATVTTAFAYKSSDLTEVVTPVAQLIYDLLKPALIIVGAVGTLYCVILGVKYSKCEEPQEREKAKGNLKNAIIGFVLIFVLMVLLKLLMPVMISWVNDNMVSTKVTPPDISSNINIT